MQKPAPTTLLVLAALAACGLLFTWRALLLGELFLPMDALLHMHPWRYSYERVPVNNQLTADAIRQIYPRRLLTNQIVAQGAWPLWNPSILSGTPLLDDSQIAFFYPPSLLFLLMPLDRAFGVYAFAQLWLAGVGAYLLARSLGIGRGGAAVAGAAYMLNGSMLYYLQLPELAGGQAAAPWCLWAVQRACGQGRWRAWGVAALLLALPLLTQLQLALYTYSTAGAIVLYHAIRQRAWRPVVGLLLSVALAIGLAAVQLFPAAALAAQGQRADVGFVAPEGDNLFGLLLRMLLPAVGGFERVGALPSWGPATIQIPYPYLGVAPLLLAGAGLLIARQREAWLWGAVALLAFAGAARSPIIPLLNAILPPHRQFDDHTRWLMIWALAIAMLAGFGVEGLRARRGADRGLREGRGRLGDWLRASPWWATAARALLIGAVGGFGLWAIWFLQPLLPGSRVGIYTTLIRQQPLLPTALALAAALAGSAALCWRRIPPALAVGVLLATLAIDVHYFNGAYNTSASPSIARPTTDLTSGLAALPPAPPQVSAAYPPTRTIAFLQSQPGPFRISGVEYEALSPNLAGAFGLEDVRGYHSLYPERYNRLARLIDGKDYGRTTAGMASLRVYMTSAYARQSVLNMLNVTYLLAPPGSTVAERFAGLELAYESDEGRIYRNTRAMPRAWVVHQVVVIADDDGQLDRLAQPDFDPAALAILDAEPPPVALAAAPAPSPLVRYAPNQVTIHASASAPGLLVLADSYYAGWEATIDNAPTRVYRANYALRAVFLPAGDHTIIFTYRPRPFLYGGALSAASLIGVLLWLWGGRPRRIMQVQRYISTSS